jgi:hypothetical protein
MGPGQTDLNAETDGKSLVAAMTASAAAAKKVCARRRPRPAGVPGAPGVSFIRTPRGCTTPSPSACSCGCAGVGGAGGGASTGCTAGRLARITPGSASPISAAPASGSRQALEGNRPRGRRLGGDSQRMGDEEEHRHNGVLRPLPLSLPVHFFTCWSGLFTWSLRTAGEWGHQWSGWWRVLLSVGFVPREAFLNGERSTTVWWITKRWKTRKWKKT